MGGRVLHVHAAQQRGRRGARAAQLPAALLPHAVSVVHQPLSRRGSHRPGPRPPTCLKPRGAAPAPRVSGAGCSAPTGKVLPCLSCLCGEAVRFRVRSSVFVYVGTVYLLHGLFIYSLFIDRGAVQHLPVYTFPLEVSCVSGTKLPSPLSSHPTGGARGRCVRGELKVCRPERTEGQMQSNMPGLVGWGLSEQVQTLPAWALHTTPTLPSQAHSQGRHEASGLPSRGHGVFSGSCTELSTSVP